MIEDAAPNQSQPQKVENPENPEMVMSLKEIDSRFNEPELILHIHTELSKDHLMDDREKLTGFIGACTAYLEPAELHKSKAFIGDSSVGKDNLIKTILKHFPKKDWIFLTNATQSTMEDDILNYKIIAYSEFNTGRDDGANLHLRETLKQMTEGGTSSIKKDVATGYKLTKHTKQEQKTVLYGSTEEEKDAELETRFVTLSIQGNPDKTKIVNDNTLDWFSGNIKDKIQSSWFADSVQCLKFHKVMIPYAPKLKGVFDNSDSRSMRDVKRIMAYTCAIAWIYQKQRKIKDGWVVSHPFDFLAAVIIAGEFFNKTYEGLGDSRLQQVLDFIDEFCEKNNTDEFTKQEVMEGLGISKSTVKRRFSILSNKGTLRFKRQDGKIYFYEKVSFGGSKRVQTRFIGVQLEDLKNLLFKKKGVQKVQEYCDVLEKLSKLCEIDTNHSTSEENEPHILNHIEKNEPPNPNQLEENPIIKEEKVNDI